MVGRDRWGCPAHRESGTCTNNRAVTNQLLEQRVLGVLRDRMLQPEAVAAYVEVYQRSLAGQRQQQGKERRRLEKKAAEAERRVARLTLAIADGGKSFAEIRVMLSAQVAKRDACRRALIDHAAEPTLVMMPHLADRYRRSIANLAQALGGDAVEVEQARDTLRTLIDAVVATPAAEGRGVALEVRGRLAAMVDVANDNSAPRGAGGCMLKGVAGAGFEPATFRL